MACCGGLITFILVIFNLLLFLIGLAPFIFGIIALASISTLETLIKAIPGTSSIETIVDVKTVIQSGAVYFIVIGVIIAIIGFVGCCGACCKSRWLLYLYLTLLILIILAEVAVIIVAVASPKTFSSGAEKVMKESLKDYVGDCNVTSSGPKCKDDAISLAWNTLQYELKCCGADSYNDYSTESTPKFAPRSTGALAPLTCCKHDGDGKFDPVKMATEGECYERGLSPDGYQTKGCFDALLYWMTTTAAVIGVMAGIGAVELILVVLTSIAIHNIRSPADKYA
jgi:hypothetical protein